jgi:hypothetical protein
MAFPEAPIPQEESSLELPEEQEVDYETHMQLLHELHLEDVEAAQVPDNAINTVQSRPHHMPKPTWAGNLQDKYGAHRRGPKARDW